jgi:DNA modification methylase
MQFQPDSLYYGDCLDVMREWPPACVDLCYLDPPFNSKASYNVLFGSDNGEDSSNGSFAQLVAFEDTWSWDDAAQDRVDAIDLAVGHPAHRVISGLRTMLGDCGMLAYTSYMAERLAEIWRVLKPQGSVYLHCDPVASHYLKVLMDGMFSVPLRREVIWHLRGAAGYKALAKNWVRGHDTILYYAKSAQSTFNKQWFPYDERQLKRFTGRDADGRRFKPITRTRRLYLDEAKGVPASSVWSDIASFQTIVNSPERMGYPTQKPTSLLKRIIAASSDPRDVVLDPFCGCGTTVVAAQNLNRRFVGIDVSHFAIDLVRSRRLKDSRIPVNGIPVDMYTARQLARDKPFEFEKWAVTRVPGLVPNQRQIGDRGIDGRGMLLDGGIVLAQVKGGNFALGQLRDFRHVLARESAACGVFTTLHPVNSTNARREAKEAGYLEMGANRYPKTQLWSIEEYFQDRFPSLPPLADPYTGKAMQMELY